MFIQNYDLNQTSLIMVQFFKTIKHTTVFATVYKVIFIFLFMKHTDMALQY